jgi:hypothetical protein
MDGSSPAYKKLNPNSIQIPPTAGSWWIVQIRPIEMQTEQNDIDTFKKRNVDIGDAETKGDKDWFEGVLAPQLAFLRADGKTFDNRDAFLDKVKQSDVRETEVESVEVYGNRAVVTCIVTLKSTDGDKRFHNLRLFVRHDGEWKILGWANEPL